MRAIISYVFFFSSRRRRTRFDCDWSSDVCSSDLPLRAELEALVRRLGLEGSVVFTGYLPEADKVPIQIGRASCREREEISVVAVSLKKKNRKTARAS